MRPDKADRMRKVAGFLVLVIILLGLIVRIAPVLHHQIFFWFDQGLDTLLVKQLVVDHRLSLISRYSGLQGVLMGPLWTWILAVPFSLGKGDPAANTVFFSLVSMGIAAGSFWFLRKSLPARIRLIMLVLFVFSPVVIAANQIAGSPHPLAFLFLFYLWWLYEAAVLGKAKFLWPLFLLAGIFFQLEIGAALFALPAIFVVLAAFGRWSCFRSRYFWLGIILFGLTFLPQILFDVRHQFIISQGLLSFLLGKGNSLYAVHSNIFVRFGERAYSFQEDFRRMIFFLKPETLSLLAFLVTVYGWYLVWHGREEKMIAWLKMLGLVLATFYLGFTLYPGPIWEWYRAGLPIVFGLMVAIGLGSVWQQARLGKVAVVGILFIYIFQGGSLSRIPAVLADKVVPDNAILENQMAAVDYVYRQAGGKPFSYFAYTPPVYDYVWAYDFWWYGQRKYGYLPINWQMTVPLLGIGEQAKPPKRDEGLFYLIMEPNKEKPWEINGWKESYIKFGTVTDEKEFPGQIIVEERGT